VTVIEAPPRAQMLVRKRNGAAEPVDVNKIVKAVQRHAGGLPDVDAMRVATRTIGGLYDGATTAELDRLSIQTAAELIGEEPQYSRLAARLLGGYLDKEVRGQGIASFSQAVRLGHAQGLIGDETAAFVAANARKLDDAVDAEGDRRFEYFGLRTVADRYLLRHPETRLVIETPQYWLLRVACGLSRTPAEAIGFYRLMSSLAYLPSSRRCSTPAPRTRRCRRASWSTRRATSWTRSTSGTRRWRSCRSSPAGSASRGPACAAGAR
jgi:ribonucleoside-diphosphate reductase alpha chain